MPVVPNNSFDPSVIGSIAEGAGNPMRAVGQAYTLADMFSEQQLRKGQLARLQAQDQEQQQTRDIVKAGDISTMEGRVALAGKLGKAGLVGPAFDTLKFNDQAQERQLQQQELHMRLMTMSQDVIGPAALEVKNVLATQGPAMAAAVYAKHVAGLLPQLPPEFRGQIPQQLPADPAQANALLDQAIGNSEKARQWVQQRNQQRHQQFEEGARTEELGIQRGRLAEEQRYHAQEAGRQGQHVETIVGPDKKPRRVLFDAQGNQVKDLGEAPAGRGEHPTEAENKAAVNYTTMRNAEDVLEDPRYKNMNMSFLSTVEEDTDGYLHAVGRFGRKAALTPEQQVVAQAARQFAEGAGHLKSGARINKDTMRLMVDLYLPLPGDSPELRARKLAARRNDLSAGRVGAGRAYEGIAKAQAAEEGGGQQPSGSSGWGKATVVGR